MNLNGKVAIVTGASTGIGAATAIKLSTLGASIVIHGRNESGLDQTIQQCPIEGRKNIVKVVGDVKSDSVLKEIVDKAIENFGKIDILINNAGMSKKGSIETCDPKDFDEHILVNLRAPFVLTQLATPHLIATKGSIVNVSSTVTDTHLQNGLAYGVSKAGLDKLTKCCANELGRKGVRVNAVNPGVTRTEIFLKAGRATVDTYDELMDTLGQSNSIGRAGYPEEIANSIAFLVSDYASFITGELLYIDGGWHTMPSLNASAQLAYKN